MLEHQKQTTIKKQLPFDFDANRLQADLEKVTDNEWISHYNPDDYNGIWQIAALMSPAGSQSNIWSCSIPEICSATPLLKRCDYFKEALDQLELPMSSVRLMKLAPKAVIKPHSDSFSDQEVRIHIPVTTNPDVDFFLDGETVLMQTGSCWYLDFRRQHSVLNRGDYSRTHLVIDAHRNDWFDKILNTND